MGLAAAGTAARITRLLERYGLPLELPDGAAVADLLGAMRLDKKTRDGAVRFALPAAVGRMHTDEGRWTVAVAERIVAEVLGRSSSRGRSE